MRRRFPYWCTLWRELYSAVCRTEMSRQRGWLNRGIRTQSRADFPGPVDPGRNRYRRARMLGIRKLLAIHPAATRTDLQLLCQIIGPELFEEATRQPFELVTAVGLRILEAAVRKEKSQWFEDSRPSPGPNATALSWHRIGTMCAVKKDLLIDFTELHSLEIHCRKCGTKITIDFNKESLTPSKCPSCSEEFGGGYSVVLRNFREAFRSARVDQTPPLRFRIPFTEG